MEDPHSINSQFEGLHDEPAELPLEEDFDSLKHLQAQLRAQTARLRQMEQYKDICEQRLRELQPGHPLPVREEDLGGHSVAPAQEVHRLHQKIARLEHQLSQQFTSQLTEGTPEDRYVSDLRRDKEALESCLRAEMLQSEEQRSYIEVLKQALETRMSDLGIAASVDAFADFTQAKALADEARRESAKVQHTLADQEIQLKRLKEQLQIRTNELGQISDEKASVQGKLGEAAEAIKYAEEEIQQLEEEKANLIDYIEKQEASYKSLFAECEEYKSRHSSVSGKHEGLKMEFDKQRHELVQLEAKHKVLSTDSTRTESALKEMQQNYMQAKARIEEKDKSIGELRAENQSQSSKAAQLTSELSESSAMLNQRFEDNQALKSENLNLLNQNSELLTQIERHSANYARLQEDKTATDSQLQATLNELANTSKQLKNTREELDKAYKQCRDTEHELRTAVETSQHISQREKFKIEENNQLNSQLSDSKAQNRRLTEDYQRLELKNEEHIRQIQINEKDIGMLKEQILRLEKALETEQSTNKNLEDHLANSKGRNDELTREVSRVSDALNERENRLRGVEMDAEGLATELDKARQELRVNASDKETLRLEIERTNTQNRALDSELQALEIHLNRVNSMVESGRSRFTDPAISRTFKEVVDSYPSSSKEALLYYLETSSNEILKLAEQISDLNKQVLMKDQEAAKLAYEIELKAQENEGLRAREQTIYMQLDSSVQENRQNREDHNRKLDNLQSEISSNRQEIQYLQDNLQNSNNQVKDLMAQMEEKSYSLALLEEKNTILEQEKSEYDRQIQQLNASNVYSEISRNKSEVFALEMKKRELSGQLSISDNGYRADLLRNEIGRIDSQLQNYKDTVYSLENELRTRRREGSYTTPHSARAYTENYRIGSYK